MFISVLGVVMTSSFELETTPDGQILFHGDGTDLERLEAVVRWHANSLGVETGISIAREPITQWQAFHVEIQPSKDKNGDQLICALDQAFRMSGNYKCIRRWVRGKTWGWLIRHLPGKQWFQDAE